MEVVSFKLYQRKLIFDDLSAMFYNGRWRERVGLAWGSGGVRVGVCVCGGGGGVAGRTGGGGGGGGRETDRDSQTVRQTERERESCIKNLLFFNCFAGDCS